MRLMSAFEYHKALGNWIVEHLTGKKLSISDRTALPAGCFDVAIEHQNGIVVLCASGHFGPAFALIRIIFEACVRGVWLHNCATEQEIAQYKNDTLDRKFSSILKAVEQSEGFNEGILGNVKRKYWKAMNSFTHTGILQVSRRLSEDSLGPNYSDEDVLVVLGFSGAMCLFAAQQIALLADDLVLAETMLRKMAEFTDAKF